MSVENVCDTLQNKKGTSCMLYVMHIIHSFDTTLSSNQQNTIWN